MSDVSSVKFTNLGSYIVPKWFLRGPFDIMWRVRYYKEPNEFAPCKPLYFLKGPLVLQGKGSVIRVL